MTLSDLPALNATLNGLSAVFITTGYVLIRRGQRNLHKRCMLAALATSTAFLVSYVVYHANVGSRPFPGSGAVRVVYFAILITHVVLAATIVPLALTTTTRGLRQMIAGVEAAEPCRASTARCTVHGPGSIDGPFGPKRRFRP